MAHVHSTKYSRKTTPHPRGKTRLRRNFGASFMNTMEEAKFDPGKMRKLCHKYYIVECWNDSGWKTRIRHVNGNILYAAEQVYSSKSACLDTATKFAEWTGAKLVIRD